MHEVEIEARPVAHELQDFTRSRVTSEKERPALIHLSTSVAELISLGIMWKCSDDFTIRGGLISFRRNTRSPDLRREREVRRLHDRRVPRPVAGSQCEPLRLGVFSGTIAGVVSPGRDHDQRWSEIEAYRLAEDCKVVGLHCEHVTHPRP